MSPIIIALIVIFIIVLIAVVAIVLLSEDSAAPPPGPLPAPAPGMPAPVPTPLPSPAPAPVPTPLPSPAPAPSAPTTSLGKGCYKTADNATVYYVNNSGGYCGLTGPEQYKKRCGPLWSSHSTVTAQQLFGGPKPSNIGKCS